MEDGEQTVMQTCSNSNEQVGYEILLPPMVAHARIKEVADEQLTDAEFRSVVATIYRDSVIQMMRDTGLYQMDIPIDIYEGVKNYHFEAPKGFMVDSLVDILPNKCEPKNYITSNHQIVLKECPTADVHQAFYARVSVLPKRDTCEFDKDFVDRYYDILVDLMLSKMLSMPTREWKSLEQSRLYFQSYYRSIGKERYKVINDMLISNATDSVLGALMFEFGVSLYRQGEEAELMNPIEFKRIFEMVFQNAVRKIMDDTNLYRVELPIDLYEGVKQYDIIPPDGFYVGDVGEFKAHKVKVPKHTNDTKSIELNCCPKRDVSEAFYVEVALVAEHGHSDFDEDFLKRNHALIKLAMQVELYGMKERYWYDPGMMGAYKNQYDTEVQTARRRAFSGGSNIKLKSRRMSSYA